MGNLFFRNQNTDTEHTDGQAIKLIRERLLEAGPQGAAQLYGYLKGKYPDDNINRTALRVLLGSSFDCDAKTDDFYLRKEDVRAAGRELAERIAELVELGERELACRLYASLSAPEFRIEDTMPVLLASLQLRKELPPERCAAAYQDLRANGQRYYAELERAVSEIGPENENVELAGLIRDPIVRDSVAAYGIAKAGDLREVPAKILFTLISLDAEDTLRCLQTLSGSFDDKIGQAIAAYFQRVLDERSDDVLASRYGLRGRAPKTLEECAGVYGLTRERIRQIEQRALRIAQSRLPEIDKDIRLALIAHLDNKGRAYLTVTELGAELNNPEAARRLALLVSLGEYPVRYDDKIDCLYNKEKTDSGRIIGEELERHRIFITEKEAARATPIGKAVIALKYRPLQTGAVLIRNGLRITDMYDYIIRESFPEGYRIYSEEDHQRLAKACLDKYGPDFPVPTAPAVRGLIDRDRCFCQIDRGTYRPREYCAALPAGLQAELLGYVTQRLPMVEYISIYEQFREELNHNGVDSYFYLKGLLDPLLPEGIITRRNYLTLSDRECSAAEAKRRFIRGKPGAFSLDDLRQAFPGVRDYTFQILLYSEAGQGLIWLPAGRFIYFDKLGIDKKTVAEVKEFVRELFGNDEQKVLTSRKIYDELRRQSPGLSDRLGPEISQFSLFSVLKYLMADELCFRRPYAALSANRDLTIKGVLFDHLSKLERISHADINKLCRSLMIPCNFSFNSVVEDYADDFVQTDNDAMVRKDRLDISEQALQEISRALRKRLAGSSEASLDGFTDYDALPKLRYPWNECLLAGIVRSYLEEDYEIRQESPGHFIISTK